MNPITRRHRMWARTSGPDRQAERPAHHRGQRQRHRTRTALAGAGIPGTAAINAVLPGGSLPASAAPAIRTRRGRPAPGSSMAPEGPVTSASTWQPTRKRSPGR
jgi:hypothetical protein